MEVSNLFHYLRNRIVKKQVDIKGDLQTGLERILMENIEKADPLEDRSGSTSPHFKHYGVKGMKWSNNQHFPSIRFVRSDDPRVDKLDVRESYLGESILDVITNLENNYPIHICATPNEENGYDLSVEYKG